MSDVGSAGTTGGELGERRLGTIHAVAQALAIGPMFSTAVVLGFVRPGSPGLGSIPRSPCWSPGSACWRSRTRSRSSPADTRVRVPSMSTSCRAPTRRSASSRPASSSWVRYSWAAAASILGLGILTNGFWTEHISKSNVPAWWLLALLFMALVLVLNYIGVRIAIGAMLTFAALSFTPMLILAVAIIFQANEHACGLQPLDDVGSHRLQRRDARHPAVRGLRGGRVDSARRATTRPSRSHGR